MSPRLIPYLDLPDYNLHKIWQIWLPEVSDHCREGLQQGRTNKRTVEDKIVMFEIGITFDIWLTMDLQ